jgi:hypothetical protein
VTHICALCWICFFLFLLYSARGKLNCSLCDRTNGTPVQCFNPRCSTAYHVSCAYASGWQFSEHPKGANTTQCPFISFCGEHSKLGIAANPLANPQFATATFTPYTLPDSAAADEDRGLIDLTRPDGKINIAGGSAKRGRPTIAIIDSDDEDFEEDTAGGKRSGSGNKRDSGGIARTKRDITLQGGVGQLVFEPKKKDVSRSASIIASGIVPSKTNPLRKIIFLQDNVVVYSFLQYKDPSRARDVVFINSDADAAKAVPLPATMRKRKLKRGNNSGQAAVVKGVEEEEEESPIMNAANVDAMDMEDVGEQKSNSDESFPSALNGITEPTTPSDTHRAKRRRKGDTAAVPLAAAVLTAAPTSAPIQSRVPTRSSATNSSRIPRSSSNTAGGTDVSAVMMDDKEEVEEDLEALHCICRQPWHSTDVNMLACDGCDIWFHTVCIGVTKEQFQKISSQSNVPYFCPSCADKE